MTLDEIMEQFDVTREQFAAVLDFAARSSTSACMGAEGNPGPFAGRAQSMRHPSGGCATRL